MSLTPTLTSNLRQKILTTLNRKLPTYAAHCSPKAVTHKELWGVKQKTTERSHFIALYQQWHWPPGFVDGY